MPFILYGGQSPYCFIKGNRVCLWPTICVISFSSATPCNAVMNPLNMYHPPKAPLKTTRLDAYWYILVLNIISLSLRPPTLRNPSICAKRLQLDKDIWKNVIFQRRHKSIVPHCQVSFGPVSRLEAPKFGPHLAASADCTPGWAGWSQWMGYLSNGGKSDCISSWAWVSCMNVCQLDLNLTECAKWSGRCWWICNWTIQLRYWTWQAIYASSLLFWVVY